MPSQSANDRLDVYGKPFERSENGGNLTETGTVADRSTVVDFDENIVRAYEKNATVNMMTTPPTHERSRGNPRDDYLSARTRF